MTKKKLEIKIYQKQSKLKIGSLLLDACKDFFGSHFLALQLAKRDISAQYRQSYLGILWLFITPLATAGVWIFFKAVVQAMFLFGLETWLVTPCMGRDLGGFQD